MLRGEYFRPVVSQLNPVGAGNSVTSLTCGLGDALDSLSAPGSDTHRRVFPALWVTYR